MKMTKIGSNISSTKACTINSMALQCHKTMWSVCVLRPAYNNLLMQDQEPDTDIFVCWNVKGKRGWCSCNNPDWLTAAVLPLTAVYFKSELETHLQQGRTHCTLRAEVQRRHDKEQEHYNVKPFFKRFSTGCEVSATCVCNMKLKIELQEPWHKMANM